MTNIESSLFIFSIVFLVFGGGYVFNKCKCSDPTNDGAFYAMGCMLILMAWDFINILNLVKIL